MLIPAMLLDEIARQAAATPPGLGCPYSVVKLLRAAEASGPHSPGIAIKDQVIAILKNWGWIAQDLWITAVVVDNSGRK